MVNCKTSQHPILVHHTGSLGDTLASIPALRAIRAHFPNTPLHLLFDIQGDNRAVAIDILAPLNLVDEYISYSHTGTLWGQLSSYFTLWRTIGRSSYSEAISLLPSSRSRLSLWRDRVFYTCAGIWKSTSFRWFENLANRQLKEAQLRLFRLSALNIPSPTSDIYSVEVPSTTDNRVLNWLTEQRCLPRRPLIAVCPGAKTKACIWPLENFLELGRKLLAEGTELVLLGGPEHQRDAERLLSSWGSGINGVGKFSVWETASALKHCDLLVGVDTGTTHLAAAVGTQCLAIFSQRETSCRWEPMGSGHQIIRHPVPCQNCGLSICKVPGHPCMTGTTVDVVFARVQRMLHEREEHRKASLLTVLANDEAPDKHAQGGAAGT